MSRVPLPVVPVSASIWVGVIKVPIPKGYHSVNKVEACENEGLEIPLILVLKRYAPEGVGTMVANAIAVTQSIHNCHHQIQSTSSCEGKLTMLFIPFRMMTQSR